MCCDQTFSINYDGRCPRGWVFRGAGVQGGGANVLHPQNNGSVSNWHHNRWSDDAATATHAAATTNLSLYLRLGKYGRRVDQVRNTQRSLCDKCNQ